ncbi:MAG: general secretion pathway protein GspK [Planctomycetes bacterium]|nr:general secretion pathway protein GspK [Planctomycetota bacterium]MCC7173008.1 general secretion pathway protein GspK [Planctomycetota bacterium]
MHRSRERGVALILVFLTVLILVVVIMQIQVTATVDASVAHNTQKEMQFEYAASGALEEAKGHLLRDLKEESEQSQAGGGAGNDPLGAGGGTGDPFGGTGGADGGDEASADPADSIGPDEDWANFDKLTYAGEIEVSVRLIDEDRKFNVLQLATEDEDARKAAKERFIRLLDTFREDSKHDLSVSEATEIVEGMEAWLKGDRPDDFPKPKQPVKVDSEGKEVEEDENEAKVHYPLGLEEFIGIPVLTEFMLHGYLDEDGRRFVPGIEDVATVFSSQTYDESAEPQGEEDEEFKNPFDASSKDDPNNTGDADKDEGDAADDGEGEDDGDAEGDAGGGEGTDGGGETAATNEGRINVNTAPIVVLRSLLPNDEMPWSVLEKIDEFRRKAFEEQAASAQDLFDKNKKKDKDDDSAGGSDDEDGEEEEEDFVFHSSEEVIDKVEKHFETTFDLSDETKTKFTELLATKSHVFTVLIGLRDTRETQNQSSLFQKNEGQVYNRLYRAVLWRRQDGDGKFKAITLSPLTRYNGVLPPDTEEYKEDFPFGF